MQKGTKKEKKHTNEQNKQKQNQKDHVTWYNYANMSLMLSLTHFLAQNYHRQNSH